jgi:starvation-inducible DNA-binding protein
MFLSNDNGVSTSFAKQATPMFKAAPEVVAALRPLLADVYAMQTAVQGAHWNVQGTDFAQYHELFAEIYSDVADSIDPLAENILKAGGLALASLTDMQALRTTTDPVESRDARQLAIGLAAMNDAVLVRINAAFLVAESQNEPGISNFLADRDDMHKKWRWQLRASLGEPVG